MHFKLMYNIYRGRYNIYHIYMCVFCIINVRGCMSVGRLTTKNTETWGLNYNDNK